MKKNTIQFAAMALSAAMLMTALPMQAQAAGKYQSVTASGNSKIAAVDLALVGMTGVTGKKNVSTNSNAVEEQQTSEVATADAEETPADTVDTEDTSAEEESEDESGDEEMDDEFGHLVIARVDSYVNVRKGPTTDSEKLGKLWNNSVGELVRREGDWLLISSGTVLGFVKAEYVVYGEEAEAIIDDVMIKKATVTANSLNFRSEPSTNASVYQHLPKGAVYDVVSVEEEWVQIKVGKKTGYVSAQYVSVTSSFVSAESKEEEKARLAAEAEQARLEKEAEEAAKAAAAQAAAEEAARQAAQSQQAEATQTTEQTTQPATTEAEIVPANTGTAEGAAKGQAVVDFAVQFVGNPYVYGGTSLTKGADCSGFVLSVYKEFGVSLPHSATADQKMGTAVASLEEARPGDLLCYSGHVGIYIGNGKFVHASNPKGGIKIGDANYRKILAIRRIFN